MVRVVTAVGLLALLGATLWLQEAAFVALVSLLVILAWREFAGLAAEAGAAPLRGLGAPLAVACALGFARPEEGAPLALAIFAAAVIIGATGSIAAGRHHPALAVRRTIATVGGLLWLGLLPGLQIGLRYRADGVAWLILLVAVVSSGDIAAYYGGRLWGRHALAPSLSPNKTIEGTLFGLAASVISAVAVSHYWPDWQAAVGAPKAALLGLVLGACGQVGDLFESALKRAARAKDSSSLLPGHGGLLDRIDALLFAGGVLYVALAFGYA